MSTNKLIDILSIQSESFNQQMMFSYLEREVSAINGCKYHEDEGNLYVTKGSGYSYPCVVAHMDTVHGIVEDLTVVNLRGNLTGFNAVKMQQTGIGGDDKVGIFIALECLRLFDTIKVVFFRDEEVGCHGSYEADPSFFEDCNFILQCDRQGRSDFITKAGGTKLSSKRFQKDIFHTIASYGYAFNKFGMMTDVMALKELDIPISMANISCGYYNPHMENEYVNIKDVQNCLEMVQQILWKFGDTQYPHQYEDKWAKDTKPYAYPYDWGLNNVNTIYCKDCWAAVPVSHGLCASCLEYYEDYFPGYSKSVRFIN